MDGPHEFCKFYSDWYNIAAYNLCLVKHSEYKASIEAGVADEDTIFCEELGCDSIDRTAFPFHTCENIDFFDGGGVIDCFHGEIMSTHTQHAWRYELDGITYNAPLLDLCEVTNQFCRCDFGWSGDDCSETAANATLLFEERSKKVNLFEARLEKNMQKGKEIHATVDPVLLEEAAHNMRTNMGARGGSTDCYGGSWEFFADSAVDGVTYGRVGPLSAHEYYGIGFWQDGRSIKFLFSLNLMREGYVTPEATVSMGDLILNFNSDESLGRYETLPEVSDKGELWAIRHDDTNESPVELGVYKNVQLKSITGTNMGFGTIEEYDHFVNHVASTSGSVAAYNKFGGALDDQRIWGIPGVGYLGSETLNVIDETSPQMERTGDVEIEYFEFSLDEPFFDIQTAQDFQDKYTLQFYNELTPNNFLGTNARIITIDRKSLPHSNERAMIHQAQECYNDVVSAEIQVCELPSHSPTISTTRSPTSSSTPSPTRTVTTSTTPEASPSPTRSGSQSSAPSFARIEECYCASFDGEEDINTLVLGDFLGGSDTEGRLFICGDAQLKSYSVGAGLDENLERDDLFVSGELIYQSGRVHAGNLVYGGAATIPDSVVMGMYNRSIRHESDRFDCDGATAWFRHVSMTLGDHDLGGTTSIRADGTLDITRTEFANPAYFEVNCEDLEKVKHVSFNSIPETMTVVVNFRGESCKLQSMTLAPTSPEMVIYNFPDATELIVNSVSIEGNIFAPYATMTGLAGVITGQIVVGAFDSKVQQNVQECQACIGKDLGLIQISESFGNHGLSP